MARFWDVELTRLWRVFITPDANHAPLRQNTNLFSPAVIYGFGDPKHNHTLECVGTTRPGCDLLAANDIIAMIMWSDQPE
ncbi:MAG: hypothetical protein C5S47_03235 [Candidatus Methanogasteraceae archaeon]|nr:MAG: hypothetical protein C5S47_03235 [ANME-2 cluster archaeon]